MPDADLRSAMEWEAAQRFDLERSRMELGFLRTGADIQGSEKREEVLLVAASHDDLESWLLPMVEAGLRPIAVEPWFVGLSRVFSRLYRREQDRSRVRAVVDVSRDSASIIILRGEEIAMCRTTNIGGEQFDRALAEHLQLDLAAARDLRTARIAHACGGVGDEHRDVDPATDRAVFEAVRPLMGELVNEVSLCLRYYGVTFRGHPPERILLSGGDALEPHLVELLEQGCNIPVSTDDEMGALGKLVPAIRAHLHREPGAVPVWPIPCGLSLRGLRRKSQADSDAADREVAA